ncbi:MAG: phage holin [Peptococcaceae bacterium]|nr:phage holin [Peptococcaceae bacterium]
MSTTKTNITSGTIARTIILALALVNQLLSVTGHAVLPIEDAQIETLVSTIWTIVAAVVAWWKNNSITESAVEADKVKTAIKEGKNVEIKETSERRVNSL